jgi:gamma-glutamylaminecyclotransferase
MSARLFVYGTLKHGFPNQHLNRGRQVAGSFRTRLAYPLYVVALPNEDRAPWLMNEPGEGRQVTGQVFEVSDDALHPMDVFEEVGHPDGYLRVEVELEAAENPAMRLLAFAYMKHPSQLSRCLVREGPFEEYTLALAAGYRLSAS